MWYPAATGAEHFLFPPAEQRFCQTDSSALPHVAVPLGNGMPGTSLSWCPPRAATALGQTDLSLRFIHKNTPGFGIGTEIQVFGVAQRSMCEYRSVSSNHHPSSVKIREGLYTSGSDVLSAISLLKLRLNIKYKVKLCRNPYNIVVKNVPPGCVPRGMGSAHRRKACRVQRCWWL